LTTDEGFGLIGCRGPKFKDIDDATDDGRADEMLYEKEELKSKKIMKNLLFDMIAFDHVLERF
jgi:hypothetical protein